MKDQLLNILKGKIVIVGIGNILKGDDGFGPLLVQRLQGKTRAVCLDAGTAPESYAGKVIKEKPDTILLIDAVHLEQPPGTCDILEKTEILRGGLTTHDLSPRLLIDFLEGQTGAQIFLLGVQPQGVDYGQEMSAGVAASLDNIEVLLKEVLHA